MLISSRSSSRASRLDDHTVIRSASLQHDRLDREKNWLNNAELVYRESDWTTRLGTKCLAGSLAVSEIDRSILIANDLRVDSGDGNCKRLHRR